MADAQLGQVFERRALREQMPVHWLVVDRGSGVRPVCPTVGGRVQRRNIAARGVGAAGAHDKKPTARTLWIGKTTLYRKLKRYQIERTEATP
jgi:transcriptional regulator of acetoin/glycerol metabolism